MDLVIIAALGFDTWEGVLWNTLAYVAFGLVIFAFQTGRRINEIVLVAGVALGVYSYFFLGNGLFTALQGLIALSALFQLINSRVPRANRVTAAGLLVVTACTLIWLVGSGYITDPTEVIGAAGLIGIAFGLIFIPHWGGHLVLALSSILLVDYSFTERAWVFLLLNIYFWILNLRKSRQEFKKQQRASK